MKETLAGHRALVTGASGGLGAAIVRRLATEGMEVLATGRRREPLESLAANTGAEVLVCDLTVRSNLGGLLEKATSVDLLVCNAALPATGPLEDFSVDEIDRALDVNLRAPILLSRAAGPAMASRGGGHIVFMSSMGAKAVGPSLGGSPSPKAAWRGFSLAFCQDPHSVGGGFSAIFPGRIADAGMWAAEAWPT